MSTDSLIKARKQLEQEKMLKALYRWLWDAAHPNSLLPCPLLSAHRIREEICDLLEIRYIARK